MANLLIPADGPVEAQVLQVLDDLPNPIWRSGIDGGCDYFNSAWLEFTGRSLAEELGNGWTQGVHPEDLEGRLSTYRTAFEQRQPFEIEYRLRHRDGTYHWLLDYGRPIYDLQDQFAGYIGSCYDTTNRKQTEEAARKSRAMLVRAQRVASTGSWEWDFQTGELLWSDQMYRIFGLAPGAVQPRFDRFLAMVHPDDRQRLKAAVEDARAGTPCVMEYRIVRQDASVRHIRSLSEVEYTKTNEPLRMVGTALDVTDRKMAEEALQASQEKYRSLIENLNDVVYTTDMDGRITYMSPVVERWMQYKVSDLLGRPFVDFVHPDDLAGVVESFQLTFTQEPKPYEARWLDKDGSIVYVRTNGRPLLENGRPIGVIGAATHITQQKQAEMALRASERMYRSLVDNIPDVVWTADGQGHVIFFSANAQRIHGYSLEDLQRDGNLWFERVHPDDVQGVQHAYEQLVKHGRMFDEQYRLRTKDGRTIWIHDRAVSTYERDGVRYVDGVYTDITQHKATEDALRQTEEHLRQAQKLEAVALLAGGVAHDFRNQLTVIKGYSEMLLRRKLVDPDATSYLEEILKAASRSASLTGDLLSFSRRQELHPQKVDVNCLLSDMHKTLASLVGEDVSLAIQPAAEPAWVQIDPAQFQQTLVNLVVNARHAMPRGGDLTIEVAAVQLDDQFVRHHVGATQGPHIRISIRDTGTGMDESIRLRIFEPFFTTKPVGQGTGLGLPMVYGYVQQSGGCIHVESEPGRGSVFDLYFPCLQESTGAAVTTARQNTLTRGRETVLVVEDETAIRPLLTCILEECGYTVLAAGHPAEALSLLRRSNQPIDLLVTDVVMPDMNGVELARHVKVICPSARVLFISGYTGGSLAQRGFPQENAHLLTKPFTAQQVADAVRQVLADPAVVDG